MTGRSKESKKDKNKVQKFDKMCITMYWDNSQQTQLANQGIPGIWVGFAEDHPVGAYHVYSPEKN